MEKNICNWCGSKAQVFHKNELLCNNCFHSLRVDEEKKKEWEMYNKSKNSSHSSSIKELALSTGRHKQ